VGRLPLRAGGVEVVALSDEVPIGSAPELRRARFNGMLMVAGEMAAGADTRRCMSAFMPEYAKKVSYCPVESLRQ